MTNTKLIADQLRDDPRIGEARRLISETVAEHSKRLTDVAPPHRDLSREYDSLLANLTAARKDLQPTSPILSQTFTGSSSSIAAGLAIFNHLESTGCFGDHGSNASHHQYFVDHLNRLAKKYPGRISGPFGEGMMIAMTPGDGTFETAKDWVRRLYAAGLMCFLCGGHPYRLRFLPPPGATTTEHFDRATVILEAMLASLS